MKKRIRKGKKQKASSTLNIGHWTKFTPPVGGEVPGPNDGNVEERNMSEWYAKVYLKTGMKVPNYELTQHKSVLRENLDRASEANKLLVGGTEEAEIGKERFLVLQNLLLQAEIRLSI